MYVTEHVDQTSNTPEHTDDFTRPNIDAVTEGNWQELTAAGVTVLDPCVAEEKLQRYLKFCQSTWGTANVLTGDPFDEKEGRPLHHMPGRGIYVRPEGTAYRAEMEQRNAELLRQLRTK
jgi:hypothetical protein